MGNSESRCSNIFRHSSSDSDKLRDPPSTAAEPTLGEHFFKPEEHHEELEILRRIIEHNPELFILNNLMMSIQFFENYEEEMMNIKQTLASASEHKINTRLPSQKHVLLPDILEEQVSQNVNFTYLQPTLMIPAVETLKPIRIYVVYDNIEVTEQNFITQYSKVNETITYNMQLKYSKHKGYALLQRLEVNPCKKKSMSVSTIYSDSNNDVGKNNDSNINGRSSRDDNEMTHKKSNNNNSNISLHNCTSDKTKSNGCGSCSLKSTGVGLHHRDNNQIYDCNDYCKNDTTSTIATRYSRSRPNNNNMNQNNTLSTSRCDAVRHNKDVNSSNRTSPAESTSSGYRSGIYTIDSDSDDINYNFRSINEFNVNNQRNNNSENSNNNNNNIEMNSEIPHQCFEIYNPSSKNSKLNDKKKSNRNDKMIMGMTHYKYQYDVWYLSSQKFMEYFYKQFTGKLSLLMGFDLQSTQITNTSHMGYSEIVDSVVNGTYGPIIYCDKFESIQIAPPSPLTVQFQSQAMKNHKFAIIPCVWTMWPEVANEWTERPRDWPHYRVVEKIKEIGCYLIPKGYLDDKDIQINSTSNAFNSDRNRNNNNNNYSNSSNASLRSNFEWEVTFPEAERYLETCMTYSQVRVYLMTLILQKTFIQSTIVDSYPGLTGSHIRNQLFWLIETEKPSKWLDNRMGEALMQLLKSLYRCISQDVPFMPDYFIRDKNIFQGKIYLLRTQKQLKRIIENPIMYLLRAMQNIDYRSNFFPTLDYNILLKILTNDILTLINPQIFMSMDTTKISHYNRQYNQKNNDHNEQYTEGILTSHDDTLLENNYKHRSSHDRGFWNDAKNVKSPSTVYKKPAATKTLIDTILSYDQVLEITVRCAELQEPRRLCLLLDLFIKHFIKIAEYCYKYGADSQKSIYIDQALRLSTLLLEYNAKDKLTDQSDHIKENVKIYMNKLQSLKSRNGRINSKTRSPNNIIHSEQPPEWPLPPPPTHTSESNYDNITESNINQNNNDNSDKHVVKAVVHTEKPEVMRKEVQQVVLIAPNEANNNYSMETTYI